MKILFTADLHSNKEAFKGFIQILDAQDFDIGIIAGDLTEGVPFPPEILMQRFNLTPKDFPITPWEMHSIIEIWPNFADQQSLMIEEQQLKKILHGTKKPILLITGNHDQTKWESEGNIHNIHLKSIKMGKFNFVGFKDTEFEANQYEIKYKLQKLKPFMRENTILITHIPPLEILDERTEGEHLGSWAVSEFIEETNPKIHLFGHIHESAGIENNEVNGSYPIKKQFVSINVNTGSIDTIDHEWWRT